MGKFLVVKDFLLGLPVELVRPPAQREGLVRILDNLRLMAQWGQNDVLSDNPVKLLKRN